MKANAKKILTLVLSSSFLFACDAGGGKEGGNSENVAPHEHELIRHEAVEATCVSAGNPVYYTCSCGKIFDANEQEIASIPTTPIDPNAHDYVLTVSGAYKTAYNVGETFVSDGMSYSLVCSRDASHVQAVDASKVTFVYPTYGETSFSEEDFGRRMIVRYGDYTAFTSPLSIHAHAMKSLRVEGTYKTDYYLGETWNASGVKVIGVCSCGQETEIPLNEVTFAYPNAGETSMTIADNGYSMVVKYGELTAYTNPLAVSVRDNELYGMPATLSAHCGEALPAVGATSLYGEVEYGIAKEVEATAKENLTYESVVGVKLTAGTYWVKATAKGLGGAKDAVGYAKLTVAHRYGWTEGEEEDTYECANHDGEVKTFHKVVTAANEVCASEASSLDLAGVSEYASVESIKVKLAGTEYDLGKDLNAIVFPDEAKAATEGHGLGKEIDVTVKDETGGSHLIKVKTDIITKYIASSDDFKSIQPRTAGQIVSGYYKVTADFDAAENAELNWFANWDTAKFKGTIDGDKHKLGLRECNQGMLNFLEGATIKDVTIQDIWWRKAVNYALMARKIANSVFDNVHFATPTLANASLATADLDSLSNYGYIGLAQVTANTFSNCVFDFGSYKMPCLLSHDANNHASTFVNCILNCAGYQELYYSADVKGSVMTATGLTINDSTAA